MIPGLFGDHWASGSFEGAMHAPLHVLVVLLCSVYRVFSCSLPFLGSPISPPPIVLIIVGSPLFFQFSVMGAGAGFFWQAGLVAGLQVGQALKCSSCLDLGSAAHVPGHPTCDEGKTVFVENFYSFSLGLLLVNLLLKIQSRFGLHR